MVKAGEYLMRIHKLLVGSESTAIKTIYKNFFTTQKYGFL